VRNKEAHFGRAETNWLPTHFFAEFAVANEDEGI
jgi:hypothetical protein